MQITNVIKLQLELILEHYNLAWVNGVHTGISSNLRKLAIYEPLSIISLSRLLSSTDTNPEFETILIPHGFIQEHTRSNLYTSDQDTFGAKNYLTYDGQNILIVQSDSPISIDAIVGIDIPALDNSQMLNAAPFVDLSMHKIRVNQVLSQLGIKVPKSIIYINKIKKLPNYLGKEVVIKPDKGSQSKGVLITPSDNIEEINIHANNLLQEGNVLIERRCQPIGPKNLDWNIRLFGSISPNAKYMGAVVRIKQYDDLPVDFGSATEFISLDDAAIRFGFDELVIKEFSKRMGLQIYNHFLQQGHPQLGYFGADVYVEECGPCCIDLNHYPGGYDRFVELMG